MKLSVSKTTQLGILLVILCGLSEASSVSGQVPVLNRKIVYLGGSPTASTWDLWVMNADGSGKTELYNGLYDIKQPMLSPDGLKIVFVMSNNIYVINTDGTGLLQSYTKHWNC